MRGSDSDPSDPFERLRTAIRAQATANVELRRAIAVLRIAVVILAVVALVALVAVILRFAVPR